MNEIHYDISAQVSKIEWGIIQEWRRLQSSGIGEVNLKILDGEFVDARFIKNISHEKLKEDQR